MPSQIATRRLDLLRRLRGRPDSLRVDPARMRFSLGTSVADVRLPFEISAEAAPIVPQAARQLCLLLISAHRRLFSAEDVDRFFVSDEWAKLPLIPPGLGPGRVGPDARAVTELAFRVDPLLTGGVMTAWLSPGGGGRTVVALFTAMLQKAVQEMQGAKGREDTPFLVSLMLSTTFSQVERAVNALGLRPPNDRPFFMAAAAGTLLAARLGAERAVRDVQGDAELLSRVEAPLSPLLLWGRLAPNIACGWLYGCDLAAAIPERDQALSSLMSGADPEATANEVLANLLAAGDAVRIAEQAVTASLMRDVCVQVALRAEAETAISQPLQQVSRFAAAPAEIAPALGDDKWRKAFSKELSDDANRRQGPLKDAVNRLSQALKRYSPKDPNEAFGLPREKARMEYAKSALGLLADLALEKLLAPARKALDARTGREAEGGLEAEYNEGRLYRLSTGQGPILRSAAAVAMGHLFVDVKDFTRRTALLGQAAMADFLRREFYVPILASAKAHHGGMTQLSDRGGMSLNNLLGDAISMSGQIDAMVTVGIAIRRHLSAYQRQLLKTVSSEQVAESLKAIESQYEKLLQAADPATAPHLQAERAAALERARGENLEAGVFISFGPAPVVITVEDDVFGQSRVAIAEKINESARGTARSGGARARADAQLQEARETAPNLKSPWTVFCDAPFQLSFPPGTELAIRGALQRGERKAAVAQIAQPLQEALDAAQNHNDTPGDIYNAGIALSEEALLAYQEAIGDKRQFRMVEIGPDALHADIRARYFFPPGEKLKLVIGFTQFGELAEVFRYSGRVMFKGFERRGGIPVWELVDEFGIGALLGRYHAATWFRSPPSTAPIHPER